MDEQALLQAILTNPEDDSPRLIYADWLEEQLEQNGEDPSRNPSPGLSPARIREQVASGLMEIDLIRSNSHSQGGPILLYHKGFISVLFCSSEEWISSWQLWVKQYPLTQVIFFDGERLEGRWYEMASGNEVENNLKDLVDTYRQQLPHIQFSYTFNRTYALLRLPLQQKCEDLVKFSKPTIR